LQQVITRQDHQHKNWPTKFRDKVGIKDNHLEINNGIVLTTMSVKQSFHKNDSPNYSVYHSENDYI